MTQLLIPLLHWHRPVTVIPFSSARQTALQILWLSQVDGLGTHLGGTSPAGPGIESLFGSSLLVALRHWSAYSWDRGSLGRKKPMILPPTLPECIFKGRLFIHFLHLEIWNASPKPWCSSQILNPVTLTVLRQISKPINCRRNPLIYTC